jgi:hypothetical protein
MTEKFKVVYIDDEPTIYAISTTGRCLNTKRNKFIKPNPKRRQKNKALDEIEPNNLYHEYALYHNGRYYFKLVHRLVAEAFIPIPQKYIDMGLTINDLDVDHIDNVRYHNDVANLQWLTRQENVDKITISDRQRYASGSKHGMCKLSNEQLDMVGKLLEENILTQQEISIITGVPYNTILEIRAKRRFQYLSKKYDFSGYNKFACNNRNDDLLCNALLMMESGDYSLIEISYNTGVSYSTLLKLLDGAYKQNLVARYDLTKFYKRRENKYADKRYTTFSQYNGSS